VTIGNKTIRTPAAANINLLISISPYKK
jgi:hypothetical protein